MPRACATPDPRRSHLPQPNAGLEQKKRAKVVLPRTRNPRNGQVNPQVHEVCQKKIADPRASRPESSSQRFREPVLALPDVTRGRMRVVWTLALLLSLLVLTWAQAPDCRLPFVLTDPVSGLRYSGSCQALLRTDERFLFLASAVSQVQRRWSAVAVRYLDRRMNVCCCLLGHVLVLFGCNNPSLNTHLPAMSMPSGR